MVNGAIGSWPFPRLQMPLYLLRPMLFYPPYPPPPLVCSLSVHAPCTRLRQGVWTSSVHARLQRGLVITHLFTFSLMLRTRGDGVLELNTLSSELFTHTSVLEMNYFGKRRLKCLRLDSRPQWVNCRFLRHIRCRFDVEKYIFVKWQNDFRSIGRKKKKKPS